MYKRILVPTDGSPTAHKGLQEACALARTVGASLRLLNVVDSRIIYTDFSGFSNYGDLLDALCKNGEEVLMEAKKFAMTSGVSAETKLIETQAATVSDVILQEVESWPADLIVMGTHGRRGLSHLVMGSDAESVLRLAKVPVLLVRAAA
ncbi:MAG: universal stress protein [Burkholderiales bacterium]|nr:universal stress protein [Burkholderiales bacterium]